MSSSSRTGPRYLGWLSLLLAVVVLLELLLGKRLFLGTFAIGALASFALFCMGHAFLKSYAFTIWVFAFVAASMFYPWMFMTWAAYDLGKLIVPLIQIIMFGMGTTLSMMDFARVVKIPWPVFIGFFLQFTVMPLVGFSLAWIIGFEPQIAAGMVLIGSCPGGVASNVMTYLAGGDVALSVTMTSCSTLASPVMTPFWMKVLAGRLVPVNFFEMMFSIINMIIVPLAAGFVANRILYGRRETLRRAGPLAAIGVIAVVLALCMRQFGPSLGQLGKGGLVVGLLLIGAVALAKLVISVWLKRPGNWMDRALPIVSMVSICFIIAIITARSRNDLLTVGPLLIVAAVAHNLTGYLLGYWLARAARLKESACRTVAIEVGMQNGGMGSALAMRVLHSPATALAPAIFGPWMNVSGSVLASWWRKKPVRETRPIVDQGVADAST
ncbi:MAG: bile acid:sodium symporter family protein [Sedimentisphaerales bacterium]|nr:bile acid:sodium symporter family protein [Sedimentisphaerales bacterium]